jgi:hypothetical protein
MRTTAVVAISTVVSMPPTSSGRVDSTSDAGGVPECVDAQQRRLLVPGVADL